jgi:hypothetical protein
VVEQTSQALRHGRGSLYLRGSFWASDVHCPKGFSLPLEMLRGLEHTRKDIAGKDP